MELIGQDTSSTAKSLIQRQICTITAQGTLNLGRFCGTGLIRWRRNIRLMAGMCTAMVIR